MDENLKNYIKIKIARIQLLKTFIENEDIFIKCIVWNPCRQGLYPHEISMLIVLQRFLVRYPKEPVMNMCPMITDTEGCIRSLIERGFVEYTVTTDALDRFSHGQLRHIISKANISLNYQGTQEMVDAIKKELSDNDLQTLLEDRYFSPTDKGKEVINAHPELFNNTFDPWSAYSVESQKEYENISTVNLRILSNIYKMIYSPLQKEEVKKKEMTGIQINEFINVLNPNEVLGEGTYRLSVEQGEYYFWGKGIYVMTENKKYIQNEHTDDFYLTLHRGDIITVVGGEFTNINNIEYRHSESEPLKTRHMYRSGLEIPMGRYIYHYDEETPHQNDSFLNDGECKIVSCKSFPSMWFDHIHSPKGYYGVDQSTKYLWILNGSAYLQSKSDVISNITRHDIERDTFNIQNKYNKMESDISHIIKGNRFYFYVSVIDPIAEIYINNL